MAKFLTAFTFSLFIVMNITTAIAQEATRKLLVKGVDAMLEGEYSKSLELLIKARDQAEKERDYKNLFVAINNIGLNYYKMMDNNEALEYYLEAYSLAIKELDPSYEMTSLNNIAVLYSEEKNLDKAIEYFQKAYNLAELPKDKLKKGIYAINLAQAYIDKNKFQIAKTYNDEALRLLQEEPDYLIEALAVKAILHQCLKQNKQAEELIRELLPKLKENRYAETRVALLLVLAEIQNDKSDVAKALSFCNQALKQQPISLETRYKIFNHINRFSRLNKDYAKSTTALDSMITLKDSLQKLRNESQYQVNRVKFEILNYETELTKGEERIAYQKRLITILGIGSALILLLLIWTIRLSRIKNRQRKDLMVRKERTMNLELENEKANSLLLEKQLEENKMKLLLDEERFKHEIETKNRKLSAKALYLIDKNQLVETIINDLERMDGIKDDAEITQHIRRLKGLLKSDEEWEKFVQYFDEVNHGLIGRLKEKHQDLNANDIRFISYLFMNLSQKEIASLMNITPEACRKRKERISKKIKLNECEDLYTYISQV